MKPVDQTVFGWPGGNCFSACVASILELPIEEVPYFMGDPEEPHDAWGRRLDAWLRPRGLYALHFENDPTAADAYPISGLYILGGRSPRGDFAHAVVACGKRIVHDPHPSRAGIGAIDGFTLLVPTFGGEP